MPEPNDLVDKLADSQEIAHELLHDLTANPVNPHEATLISICVRVRGLIASAFRAALTLVDAWPKEP